ncbi:MAG: hypothetical protein CMJ76_11230 [Planctomycetaceae bacterium]|nr:hypothetical protein [Planctomycetaceae bacterium]
MHGFPLGSVGALQDDNSTCWMHHMPIWTAAKGKVYPTLEPNQVSERVMLSVMFDLPHICESNRGDIFFGG